MKTIPPLRYLIPLLLLLTALLSAVISLQYFLPDNEQIKTQNIADISQVISLLQTAPNTVATENNTDKANSYLQNIKTRLLSEQGTKKSNIITFFILAVLITALLWLLFYAFITRRVNHLVKLTEKVSFSNFSIKHSLYGGDEFAHIGNALELMAKELEHQHEALIINEKRLRKSQLFANVASWCLDIESSELRGSENISELLGLDAQRTSINYLHFIELVHPDDRQRVEHHVKKCLEEHTEYNIQHRIIKPDGQTYWVQESGNLIYDESEKPKYLLGMIRDITEQKLFEIHMLNTRRDLNHQRLAIDLHAIVATTDIAGNITYVNDKFTEISGYSKDELLGQNHRILNSAYHPKEFFIDLWETISSGKVWEGNICNRRKNGEYYWVHTTITPHLNAQGKPDSYTSIRTDITDLKNTSDQLHLQASALESVADGIVLTDNQGKIQWVNSAYTHLTGYSFKDAIGNTPRIVKSGKYDKTFYKQLWDTILAGKTWYGETWNKAKNGHLYLEEERITPVRNKNNEITHFVAIKRDITERKKIERELAQFKSTLDETLDCVFIFEPNDFVFTYANQGAIDQIGYTQKELMQMRPCDIKPDFDEEKFRQFVTPLITGNEHSITFETIHQHKDGHRIPVEIFLQYITPDKETARYVAIVRDISNRQQLQRQLQQSQKMEAVGQLTGGIAHDFNNILASVLGYTELAREELKQYNNSDIDAYLAEIYKSGARARDLVEQMLAFSRGGDQQYQSLLAAPLIKETLRMMGSTLPSSIELNVQIKDDQLHINTDPVQLHQLVMNLCINARDAMNGKGRINIQLSQINNLNHECSGCHEKFSGNFVQIIVSDTGTGIKPEDLQRIFDPFYTTKEVGRGSGMGLAMVHGIMHDHDGHILVETEMDKGSRFTLLFPLTEKKQSVDNKNTEINITTESSEVASNASVLIVDDEASVGRFIGEILKNQGYKIHIETNSRQALLTFNQTPQAFDLLITDQTMPDMTGAELAQSIKLIRPDLPIILCSGYSNDVEENNISTFGIDVFISKPIDTQKLLLAAKRLVQIKKEDDERDGN